MEIRRINSGEIFYYHPNHLASSMYVTDAQQSVVQSFLYAPYGDIISEYNPGFNGNVLPNYAFNAKELDEETGMYYYEARYYAPPAFTSRDPLFEKYFWMSPYAYCANNPVKYVDPDGRDVETTQEGVAVLQKTVSEEDAKFIRLTEDGKIDKDFLNQCKNNEGNIGKLKEMVNNESIIVQLSISDKFDYQTEDGVKSHDMREIDVDYSFMGLYSLSTGEKGHTGQTQYPTGKINNWEASPNNKTNVIINKNLSMQGRAEAVAHELYGHAYLNIQGLPSSHLGTGWKDENLLLKTNIISSMKEVQSYFKK